MNQNLPVGLLGSKYIGGGRSPSNLPDDWFNANQLNPELQAMLSNTSLHLIPHPVKVTGKQFIVVCNSQIEYADTMEAAQQSAEKLAHQHQTEAFILKPVSKVAPKRDVVTTPITL